MRKVVMYTTASCPYCVRAKALLDSKGVQYQEIRVDLYPEKRQEMQQRSGRRTVPQIFIEQQSMGGCDELYALQASGQLDKLLGNQ
jgi:glutaredoxin 3